MSQDKTTVAGFVKALERERARATVEQENDDAE